MEQMNLFEFQNDIISAPLLGSSFLEGPAGSGKTTAGVQRMLHLVESGIPASTILVLQPQRTLAAPYYRVLRNPDFPAGMVA